MFPSSYFSCDCDSQQLSRILSPKHLQKYVGRKGECFETQGSETFRTGSRVKTSYLGGLSRLLFGEKG